MIPYGNKNLLVRQVNTSKLNTVTEINITDLDIIKDGGIYEIYGNFEVPTDIAYCQMFLKINGVIGNTDRHETLIDYAKDPYEPWYYFGLNENLGIFLGYGTQAALSNFHITLYRRSENRIYYELRADSYTNQYNRQFIESGLLLTEQNNITSLLFYGLDPDGNPNAPLINSEIKIYRK